MISPRDTLIFLEAFITIGAVKTQNSNTGAWPIIIQCNGLQGAVFQQWSYNCLVPARWYPASSTTALHP